VRLVSWNVNGGDGRAVPRQVAAMHERGADVVPLQ
jgi:hypothetical protein